MRTAHEVVGKLVGLCDRRECRLIDLRLSDFQEICDKIHDDVREYLGASNAVGAFRSYGSTGRQAVEEQLQKWQKSLSEEWHG